jgi:shikimate kinase
MAAGGGTPCFYNNIEYMKKRGIVVWINCSVEDLHCRLVGEKEHRPLVKELSDDQLKAYITKKGADRNIFYRQATTTVSGEGLSLEKLISKIFHT